MEEAIAETVAQMRVNGIRGFPTGVRFPIDNGYVTIQALKKEGAKVAIGTIVVGGVTYYVVFERE